MIAQKIFPVAGVVLFGATLGSQYHCDAGSRMSPRVAYAMQGGAPSASVLSAAQAATDLRLTGVRADDGVVTGTVLNTSGAPVRNIELLIRHTWFWNNERHPGSDSPGRADVYVVRGEIPARGELPFTYQVSPPLPPRADGHFKTTVEIVGFAQLGG